jgi:hypothetical protein
MSWGLMSIEAPSTPAKVASRDLPRAKQRIHCR